MIYLKDKSGMYFFYNCDIYLENIKN